MIRTLVADDSAAFRAAMKAVLTPAAGFDVVGEARTGAEALQLAVRLKPSLVVMDVVMPQLDGVQATAQLMAEAPCAVVVVSGERDLSQQSVVFEALRAGAVDVLAKPRNLSDPKERESFVRSLSAMSQVRVVRRRTLTQAPRRTLVVIGASTGGPPALERLVRGLPGDFSAPVLVAQHIAPGFSAGLQRWLQSGTTLPVKLVGQDLALSPGIFLAPDGMHIELEGGSVVPRPPRGEEVAPSVDRLFNSALSHMGPVLGVLLSGMGSDGAAGIAAIKAQGGHTIVQDEATSLVFGMPKVALERGGATEVLGIDAIAGRIVQITAEAA